MSDLRGLVLKSPHCSLLISTLVQSLLTSAGRPANGYTAKEVPATRARSIFDDESSSQVSKNFGGRASPKNTMSGFT
ncbi:hypothetical protein OGATHE_004801 [Ogataea polymorpha]|uniref:Uncharacterized protein n=1 Tax=Ogataea polymorpha TaxID=460523 RepID=A0A9P8P0U6_9ASCO|nr:hypothetical protein OGATHE_004801 [Ogataea polymorpha]